MFRFTKQTVLPRESYMQKDAEVKVVELVVLHAVLSLSETNLCRGTN